MFTAKELGLSPARFERILASVTSCAIDGICGSKGYGELWDHLKHAEGWSDDELDEAVEDILVYNFTLRMLQGAYKALARERRRLHSGPRKGKTFRAIRVTPKGSVRANELLEQEVFDSPEGEVLWWMQNEYVLAAPLKPLWDEIVEQYRETVGATVEISFTEEIFRELLEKGMIEIVPAVVSPDGEIIYTGV